MTTLTCLVEILLLTVLIFVLLSYTIFLYEKSNRDNFRIKDMVTVGNLWLTFRILAFEYLSLLVTVVLWPFGFINLAESSADGETQTPVLFLHGLFLNKSCWTVMKLRLKLLGVTNLHTINLPATRDVETLTEKVALKVDTLRHTYKCEKVHLVGHSMGGVIARNFVQIRGGADKVEQCIIIGAPNKGSKLSPFAVMKLSEAIMPGSEFLANLNSKTLPGKVNLTNIYSRHDNMVIPHDSAELNKGTNIELSGRGHNVLLYDNTVLKHVLSLLKAGDADDKNQQPQAG
jgi:triacylglycerol esterase/lipase EstA (alpha/beta hydrolase family)